MRKLLMAILLPVLTVWLTGCGGEGSFVGNNDNIRVQITTHSQHHGSNTDYISSNIYGARPSIDAPYTLQIRVRVSQKDTRDGVEGVEVWLDARQPEYAMISKPDEGGGDYNDFIQCKIEDDGTLSECGHPVRLNATTGADGVALFYLTSTSKTCRSVEPCLDLVASVPGVSTVTSSRSIRVGEPGSGMPANVVIGSGSPASIQHLNRNTISRIQVWVYDEKDALIHDADSGVNNVRVRILQGPGGGEELIARNAAGQPITSDEVLIRTQSGIGEFSLHSGGLAGPVLLEVIADREDNNVDNGIGEPITQHGVSYIVEELTGLPLSMDSTTLPGAKVGQYYIGMLEASGGRPPYRWEILDNTGGTPPGTELVSEGAAAGIIRGTPLVQGDYSMLIRVTDADGVTVDRIIVLSVAAQAVPTISTTSLRNAEVGTPYTALLHASGGAAPYSWVIEDGELPDGIVLNAGSGALSGTPTKTGVSSFVVLVTDNSGAKARMDLNLLTNGPDAPVISTSSLPNAEVGTQYAALLQASGGTTPYSWAIEEGALPVGLTLNANTGILSGTPTVTGVSNFIVRVTDDNGELSYTRLSIITNAPVLNAPSITTTSLPDAEVGTQYAALLQAGGGVSPYTWAIEDGYALPAGIVLNTSTGALLGMPAVTGVSNFVVRVTGGNGVVSYARLSIITNAPVINAPSITTTSLPDAEAGAQYTALLQASGGTAPYGWAIEEGALPVGLALSANTGILSGTPTVTGVSNFIVRVTDDNGVVSYARQTMLVNASDAPVISTSSLPNAEVGTQYTALLQASGGTTPYSWAIEEGALPVGLALNANTGILSGMPTVTGVSNFIVRVTDDNGELSYARLSIITNAPVINAPSITTTSLPDAEAGAQYTALLQASGGTAPYSWAIEEGALPVGLALNANTGILSGTPTVTGVSNFIIRVTDDNGVVSYARLSVITNAPAIDAPSITTTSLPDAAVGTQYAALLQASGGSTPYAWAIEEGALPVGLVLNANTGILSGTPTVTGVSNFIVRVTDDNGVVSYARLSVITNAPAIDAPSITTTSLPDAAVGTQYAALLQASGGSTPYAWAIEEGALPVGLALNANTGILSGTPTVTGVSNFIIRVTDDNGVVSYARQTILVNAPDAPAISTSALPDAVVNTDYVAVLEASGGVMPYSWAIEEGALPVGVSLNAATGILSGTPTTTGVSNFIVSVADGMGAITYRRLTLLVNAQAAPSIGSTALPNAEVGTEYAALFQASGGVAPYTWAIESGVLPAGVVLNAGTGVLSGTPTTAGVSNFIIRVTDDMGAVTYASLSILVSGPSAPSITTTSLPNAEVDTWYAAVLRANGGVTPYTWAIESGALPAGVVLDATTGALSGTPAAAGVSNFIIRVTDDVGAATYASLSILVESLDVPTIATSTLPGIEINNEYAVVLSASGGLKPYTWAVESGDLPAGISLDPNTGILSGIPTVEGLYNFTVHVADNNGEFGYQALSILVTSPAVPEIVTSSGDLPAAALDVLYTAVLETNSTFGPFTWDIEAGALPVGLAITDVANGIISGTPTQAGAYNFVVSLEDSLGNISYKALAMAVRGSGEVTIITTTIDTPWGINVPYLSMLVAQGEADFDYAWSVIGTLPTGLSLANADAQVASIEGVPTVADTYDFIIKLELLGSGATGAVDYQDFSITIN